MAGEARPDHDVFVSHAPQDRDWVEGLLLPALTASDISWCTLDSFPLGMPELERMSRAIESSARVVLVISPAHVADRALQLVSLMAQHFGSEQLTWPLVPMMIHPTDNLPLRLRLLTPLDATTTDAARTAIARLCEAAGHPLSAEVAIPPCPYPGMQPYTEDDAGRLHGRAEEVEATLAHLRLNPRCLVIGASGCGKSSLVHAGVVPALRAAGRVPVLTRPGSDPPATAREAMEEVTTLLADGRPVVLVIDQLEEVFTAAGADRAAIDAYRELVTAHRDVAVLATMRADFYPQLMASRWWEDFRDHRIEVVPLSGAALRGAIVTPAEEVGVHIETALVERLTEDADRQPGSLPFVQETLVLLWDRIEYRFLPMSAYEALVLPRSQYGERPRTGLQVAMANRADAAMAALPSDDARRIARRVFVRLVQFVDGREDVRRQQAVDALTSSDDDPRVFADTLSRLVGSHLLTSTGGQGASSARIDLSHEALIVGWPALRQWLDRRRTAETRRRELAAAAIAWQRLGATSGGLLDDVELREAERWRAGSDAVELGVEPEVDLLIAASRAAVERAAARRRRSLLILRGLSAGLSLLLVTSALLGWSARQQRDRAREERAIARSGELALTADSLGAGQLDLSLLMSLEALRLRQTPRSLGSLLTALNRQPRLLRQLPVDAPLTTATASPDGSLLAVGDSAGRVRLLDPASWRVLRSDLVIPGEVRRVAFTPDSAQVAVAGSRGQVREWDLGPGQPGPGRDLLSAAGSVRALAYSPDGAWLAAGGIDGEVVLIDRRTGSRRVLTGHRDWVNSVVFTPDSRRLISAGGAAEHNSRDGRILIREVAGGQVVTELADQGDAVRDLALAPDGARLAAAGADGRTLVWDLDTSRVQRVLTGHRDRVFAVAFDAQGSRVVTAGRDATVRVWDLAPGAGPSSSPESFRLTEHGTAVRGLAILPGGRLATVGGDARVMLWDLAAAAGPASARLAEPLGAQGRHVRAVAADETGALVALGDDEGRVSVFRVQDALPTGTPVRFDTGPNPVWRAAFGPGGRLVTASSSGVLQVWDALTGRSLAGPAATGDAAAVVAVAADGLVASGGWGGVVRFWDPQLRPLAQSAAVHRKPITALAFRTTDGTLMSAGFDSRVLAWTPPGASGAPLGSPRLVAQSNVALTSVAISPDGDTVVTGDVDGTLLFWDADATLATRAGRPTLTGHPDDVVAITFSRNGSQLYSADSTGEVRVWEAGLWPREIGRLGQSDPALGAILTGSSLIVGTATGARLWTTDPARWRQSACVLAGRNLRPTEEQDYLGRDEFRATCEEFGAPPQVAPAPGLGQEGQ